MLVLLENSKLKRKVKIIYINQRSYGRFFPEKGTDDFYLFGVGHFLAEQISNKYGGIALENWRCDKTLRREMSKKVKGIHCRIFPSIHTRRFGEFSLSLLSDLSEEMRNNCVILHLMGVHTNLCSLIAWLFRKYPVVGTHLGGANFRFKYEKMGNVRSLFRDIIEKKILCCYDHFFVQTKTERDYLRNSCRADSISMVPIYGLDFNLFRRKNKSSTRRTLNWPLNKKIMLSIGRAYHNKGIRHVLDTFSELKNDGVSLFMIGIHQDDPLYRDVVESGASFTGDVHHCKLPSYYSAADLLIYLPFDEESLNFAGPGYVNMESLACGTPVVSTLLRHFPDSEIERVSRIPQEKGDAAAMVRDILKRPPSPSICRNVVYKHYNWGAIISYHMKVYRQLYRHYYNVHIESSL